MYIIGITVNKVRLVGDPNPDRGVVEIYRSQSSDWVTICPDSWTDDLANFTCSSLGYQTGTAAVYVGPLSVCLVSNKPFYIILLIVRALRLILNPEYRQ